MCVAVTRSPANIFILYHLLTAAAAICLDMHQPKEEGLQAIKRGSEEM